MTQKYKTLEELKQRDARFKLLGIQGPFTEKDAQEYLDDLGPKTWARGQLIFPEMQLVPQGDMFHLAYRDLPNYLRSQATQDDVLDAIIDSLCYESVEEGGFGQRVYGSVGNVAEGHEVIQAFLDRVPQRAEAFKGVDSWDDLPYRRVWINTRRHAVLTYSEGSLFLAVCPDEVCWIELIKDCGDTYAPTT